MERALSRLRGEHDFAAFQSTGSPVKTSIRHMMAVHLQDEEDDLVRLTFQADGFLRHMVRALVGTLVLVGRKRMCPDEFEKILESGQRKMAGPTAPAPRSVPGGGSVSVIEVLSWINNDYYQYFEKK